MAQPAVSRQPSEPPTQAEKPRETTMKPVPILFSCEFPVFLQKIPFLAPHLRPFASICGKKPASRPSGAPQNALNGPQMNANSRKWADRTLFWPVFMLFVVLSPVFSPPRTAFDFPTSDLQLSDLGHPSSPVATHFQLWNPLSRPFSGPKDLCEAPFARSALRGASRPA